MLSLVECFLLQLTHAIYVFLHPYIVLRAWQECRPRTNLKPGIETLMVPNEQSTGRQAMASAEVAAPAAVDAIVRGNDWRSQLQYGSRGRIVNRMYAPFLFFPL
jgi:hypothetical protein